jgi:alkylation response protein AidB-like acyl-CoA dehydrogenase
MISFEPSEDQKLMIESVAQFAKTTLRPKIRDFEKARQIPEAVRKQAHELGLGTLLLPESCGGPGLGLTTAVLLEEEVAYGDAAAAFGFGGPGAFGLAVSELGDDAQKKRLLAPFASEGGHSRFGAVAWGEAKALPDRPGFATTATKKGDVWVLKGEKSYVVNADRAGDFVVFAQIDASKGWEGLGAFVVRRADRGVNPGERATTLGLDVASFGSLRLDDVEVKEADRLAGGADFNAALLRFFAKQALLVAARGVGLCRAAFDVTRDYCDTRKAFGKPIGHFQAVAFTVADRAMDADAARATVVRAAASWDAGPDGFMGNAASWEHEALLYTAYAVSYTHEAAMRCGDDAVQLHGGSGFIRDYPAEKFMRDAKQLGLCGMTAEHADQLACAVQLGGPIPLGLVLPTPETQNAFV